jgi:hypothetical protein
VCFHPGWVDSPPARSHSLPRPAAFARSLRVAFQDAAGVLLTHQQTQPLAETLRLMVAAVGSALAEPQQCVSRLRERASSVMLSRQDV